MEDQLDEFISGAVDVLVELLKGKNITDLHLDVFETARRINYLVNIAKQDELKNSLGKLENMSIEDLSEFADIITRVYKDDKKFLENEMLRLDEIFISNRSNNKHGKMEQFISICNCAYLSLNTTVDGYKEKYGRLYRKCRSKY